VGPVPDPLLLNLVAARIEPGTSEYIIRKRIILRFFGLSYNWTGATFPVCVFLSFPAHKECKLQATRAVI
jgi:hypothetical protein